MNHKLWEKMAFYSLQFLKSQYMKSQYCLQCDKNNLLKKIEDKLFEHLMFGIDVLIWEFAISD